MRARIACKVDANQKEIVKCFRLIGCSVSVTSSAGDGFPDLVVGRNGMNVLVEVKDGDKSPSKRRLTDDQIIFHDNWKGSIAIAFSVDDVMPIVRKYLSKKHGM